MGKDQRLNRKPAQRCRHSYKFAAAMQRAQGCNNPILIRVETETSHGYMPTDKRIAQTADIWSFLAYELGIRAAPKE